MWSYNYTYPKELYHHGIKGQKWGVRRYQNPDGSLTAAGRKRYSGEGGSQADNNHSPNTKAWINSKLNKRVGDIDPELAAYATSFVTSLVTLSAYSFYIHRKNVKNDDARFSELKDASEFKSFNDVPKIKRKTTAEENMKIVNPGFPEEPGSTQNCTFCTVAMAMREKGYDITANKIDQGFLGPNFIKHTFNTKLKKINTGKIIHKSEKIVKELSEQGDGAYGYLGVQWAPPYSGGHAVFWKNEGGRVRIFDGQAGKEYNIKNANNNTFFNGINLSNVRYARFDNVKPTDDVLGLIKRRE